MLLVDFFRANPDGHFGISGHQVLAHHYSSEVTNQPWKALTSFPRQATRFIQFVMQIYRCHMLSNVAFFIRFPAFLCFIFCTLADPRFALRGSIYRFARNFVQTEPVDESIASICYSMNTDTGLLLQHFDHCTHWLGLYGTLRANCQSKVYVVIRPCLRSAGKKRQPLHAFRGNPFYRYLLPL
jgi:hypothetical protein